MTVSPYIVLRNSVEKAAWDAAPTWPTYPDSKGKKFKSILDGAVAPIGKLNRVQSVDRMLDGSIDLVAGGIYKEFAFTIRAWENLSTSDLNNHFGKYSDLVSYYSLNSPTSSPSNLVTLVDNFGSSYDGYIIGELLPTPLSVIIEGVNASYLVPFRFIVKSPVAA